MKPKTHSTRMGRVVVLLILASFCYFDSARAQTLQPVVPFLDEVIVNPQAKRATAYFGYTNPNNQTVTIQVGQPKNFFFQPPEDRGQPTQFIPGTHHYAFAAIFDYSLQPVITWILNGSAVTADSATAGAQTPQTTQFTYQGRLTDGSAAANDFYQMRFSLFDSPTNGTQIGSPISFDGAGGNAAPIQVSGGIFTVQLDFGTNPFMTGANRFLEISIKKPAETNYTTLTPRQQLTSVPYAIQALSATNNVLKGGDTMGGDLNLGTHNITNAGSITANSLSGALSPSNISGGTANISITGSALSFTGSLGGDVTGTQGSTLVTKLRGVNIDTAAPTDGQVLKYDGANSRWSPGTSAFPWQVVTNTSQQALSNAGYIANNPTGQVTITLPASPNIGDIVRVGGAGAGGWKIAQNAGQSISGSSLSGTTTVGTSGSLGGGQFSAVELLFIGNGKFLVLSHEGTLTRV